MNICFNCGLEWEPDYNWESLSCNACFVHERILQLIEIAKQLTVVQRHLTSSQITKLHKTIQQLKQTADDLRSKQERLQRQSFFSFRCVAGDIQRERSEGYGQNPNGP